MLVSKYQKFLLKGNHKELDVLVFGTDIPAGWHCSPYCNTSDNSHDLAAVGPWVPQEKPSMYGKRK